MSLPPHSTAHRWPPAPLEICPFCMAVEHYPFNILARGRHVRALAHAPTCPRYLRCMECGGDAITGIWGLCFTCCGAADDERAAAEDAP